MVSQLAHDQAAVGLAAHLAGDTDIGLIGIEAKHQLVVLHGEHVGSGLGQHREKLHQAAGTVYQLGDEFQPPVPGYQTRLA